MPDTDFDVCVIGTGGGGGVMIDRLTAAGFRVVALERGPELSLADFDDDELRNVIRDQVFSRDQLETYAGWRVTRYPGPRHHEGGYTPEQVTGAAKVKTVWGGEQ